MSVISSMYALMISDFFVRMMSCAETPLQASRRHSVITLIPSSFFIRYDMSNRFLIFLKGKLFSQISVLRPASRSKLATVASERLVARNLLRPFDAKTLPVGNRFLAEGAQSRVGKKSGVFCLRIVGFSDCVECKPFLESI